VTQLPIEPPIVARGILSVWLGHPIIRVVLIACRPGRSSDGLLNRNRSPLDRFRSNTAVGDLAAQLLGALKVLLGIGL
jgi:hypothetical protein